MKKNWGRIYGGEPFKIDLQIQLYKNKKLMYDKSKVMAKLNRHL